MDEPPLFSLEPRILWLGAPGSDEPRLVGGKAAPLGALFAGHTVPPGFCVTAFEPTRDRELPAALARSIRDAYAELASRSGAGAPAVAVRSSAVDEDGARASFAGIHSTYLNVSGEDAVLDAVARCAGSAISDRAPAYRLERNLSAEGIRIAVLVQQMVPAEAAFVAFSSDPLSQSSDEVLINAAWGLGESIVSGLITPDTYAVRRHDSVITRRVTGQQTSLVQPAPGGTVERPLPEERRFAAALRDDHVLGVAELALRLEAERGHPVDVEGCRVGEALFLLQCRPITAAFPMKWEREADAELNWQRDADHFPRALGALAADYARSIYTGFGRAVRDQGMPQHPHIRIINGFVYVAWQQMGSNEELEQAGKRVSQSEAERAPQIRQEWEQRVLPRLFAIYTAMDSAPIETASPQEAAELWRELWRRIDEAWGLHFSILFPCFRAGHRLARLCAELFPGLSPLESLRLIQARTEALYRVQADLHGLAATARGWPEVVSLLSDEPESAYRRLGDARGGPEFLEALGGFLTAHGHLGAEADDPSLPAWADEPWRLLPETHRMLEVQEPPESRKQRLLAEADKLAEELRERLRDRPMDRTRFDETLAVARGANPLLEDHNYWLDRMLQARTHRLALRAGRRLVEAGAIERPEDTFLLQLQEVAALLDQPEDRRSLVRRRREDLGHWARLRAPATLGRRPVTPPPAQPESAIEPDLLRGMAASMGVVQGPVRVIRTGAEFGRVRRGDVLVCQETNPTWVPLFPVIGALVAEAGGILSHASVLAREFGVPAVVGVSGAVDMLRDGTRVEVDGGAGTIRIVESGA